LRDYLPRHTYGVVGTYREDRLVVAVAGVSIGDDDGLLLQFPQAHPFRAEDKITVQLDNRMAVPRMTAELPVHRTSYKGTVTSVAPAFLEVSPVQYEIFLSDQALEGFRLSRYRFPPDERPVRPLEESPQSCGLRLNEGEAQTSLGVLFTRAPERPHSTVMAFLSSEAGDVFIVTDPATFKAHNLLRNPEALFAVDFRDSYDLARPVTWAYRLQPMKAFKISPDRKIHTEVREAFLRKNPWNVNFFTAKGAVLLHLLPEPALKTKDVLVDNPTWDQMDHFGQR
jgi:hypothetical protein